MLTNNIDPLDLVDSMLIPHTAFARGVGLVEKAIKLSNGVSQPKCVAILGPSGAGKSKMLERCLDVYPSCRESDGMHIPALRLKVPAKPTVKALACAFLKALGVSDYTRGTETQLSYRAETLMKECKVRVIGLDDIHHFVDQSSKNVMHYAADTLKNVVDVVKCSLILTGLPYAAQLIDLNEQLARRFMAPVHLNRFLWQVDSDRQEFIDIMDAFHAGLKSYFSMPQLRSEEMTFRFYCASGGMIGYVSKTLEWATQTAVLEKRSKLTLKDLDTGYLEAVWKKTGSPLPKSPFSWKRIPTVTTDLLKTVQAFGEPGIPELRRRGAKARPTVESLTNIFYALKAVSS
jgi:hypothetical protein